MQPVSPECWKTAHRVQARRGLCLLGQYELIQEIGHGSMGVVWQARDLYADRKVCIKLLPQDRPVRESDSLQMKESFRLTHRLQHQHLCPHIQFAIDSQAGPFLVMKYFSGQSLLSILQATQQAGQVLSPSEVLRVLAPIADGLDYLHLQGLVHRDIKPGNIVVGRRPRDVQLVDFGLVEKYRLLAPVDRQIGGTVHYLAPEVWSGEPAAPESDQYALATVIYELLAGHRPFAQSKCATELMLKVQHEAVPEIARLSPDLNEVLQKALAKDPLVRFSSCRSLVKALRAAVDLPRDATELPALLLEDTIVNQDRDTPRQESASHSAVQVGSM